MAKRDRSIRVQYTAGPEAMLLHCVGADGAPIAFMRTQCASQGTDRYRFASFLLVVGNIRRGRVRKYDLLITPTGAELKELKHGKA